MWRIMGVVMGWRWEHTPLHASRRMRARATRPRFDLGLGLNMRVNGTYRAFMGPAKTGLTGGVSGSAPVCETLLWGPVSVSSAASRVNHFVLRR